MAAESSYPNDLAECHEIFGAAPRTGDADRLILQQVSQLEEQKAELAKVSAEAGCGAPTPVRKRDGPLSSKDARRFVKDVGDDPDVVDAAEGIADAALETVGGYERRKQTPKKPRNKQLPANLEKRYEVKLPVPDEQKTCPEHGERQVIGYDWQETLEVVPPKLVVRRTGIPKLACLKAPECGVVEAPRPVGLVEGNRYDTSVAAEVMVANMRTTCRSTGSKISLHPAAGRQPGAPCRTSSSTRHS